MASKRMQDKLSGTLSGWYSEEWGKTIVWRDGNLLIKDENLGDEIMYNLEQEGVGFRRTSPASPEFSGWSTELVIE